MKKSVLLGFIAIVSFFYQLNAQEVHCGTSDLHQRLLNSDPDYAQRYAKTKDFIRSLKPGQYKTVINGSNTEYHIPCVVHVIHTGGAVGTNYNPTDAAIQNFITHINEGFSNTNDVASVPGTFNSQNTTLRFYLAQRDELNSCSATTGINRVNNSSNATYVASGVGTPGITDNALKSIVHWNDLDYYNIYIVNRIDGEDGYTTVGSFTAGYAYYPLVGGYNLDGMVVLAQQVSVTSSTFIHEVGHSFNLIHPFEGGNATTCPANTDCNTDNDEVCDTDPCRLVFTCNPSGSNPCTGTAYSASTIQFNYMSYFGCTDRFTAGQVTRMNNVIDNIRTGYKNSGGVDAPVALPTFITAPTFGAANVNNNAGMGPTYVKVNTIEYTSNGYTSEGNGFVHYVDHTCNQATTLIKGNTYPITVKTELNSQKVAVYIDYDNNGTFTNAAPERIFTSTGTGGNFTHSGSFTVPASATLNTPLRMRVLGDFASSTMTPTMQLAYGQAEDYSVTILGAPLPVIWRSFTANKMENGLVDIRWSTETEFNCDHFELQHSTDGIRFETIWQTPSHSMNGESANYSYLDANALSGKNYYRVKQVDIDGKFLYSEIRDIYMDANSFNVTLYPNPVTNEMSVGCQFMQSSAIQFQVVDLNGKVIYKQNNSVTKGYHTIQIQVNQLNPGMYLLVVQAGGKKVTKRFAKM
jgi:hypothetical protein